jgi:integrase
MRKEPYWRSISKGLAVGYYKGANSGAWIVKYISPEGRRRKAILGIADDFEDADGIRTFSFDHAQEKARDWAAQKVNEDTGGIVSGPYTVAQAMKEYLAHLTKTKRKPQYRTAVNVKAHILPTLGHIELDKLTHGKVKGWRDALADAAPRVRTKPGNAQAYRAIDPKDQRQARMRQATVNRVLSILKAGLNHAKTESRRIASDTAWVDVKPFAKVDVPKIHFLSNEEVTAVVGNCEPDFQLLVKGALLTGCRYGELTALTVADFDEAKGQVYIAESKNGESRYVDLNTAGTALYCEATKGRKATEKIFLRSKGKAWKTSEQFRPMNAACKAAKVSGVTFHILRHTYASHALMAGMTIEVLAQQLGHKDTRITMRHYAHLCPNFKQTSVRQNAPSFGFNGPQDAPEATAEAHGLQLVKRAS